MYPSAAFQPFLLQRCENLSSSYVHLFHLSASHEFLNVFSLQSASLLQAQKEPLTAWEALGNADFLQLLQATVTGALNASIPSVDEQEYDRAEGCSSKEVHNYVISFEFSELPLLCHIFRIQYTIFLQIDIR